MNVGELFVKLGVKGDGSARKALKGTEEGLRDIRSMSLEAKAAIIGVIYGFQQMMSSSMKSGQSLANFAALTGQSTDALQRYQYAGKLVGLTNESVANTFVNLQKSVASLDLEGEGMQSLGGISQFLARAGESLDIQKFKTDTQYAFQMLQKFSQLDNSMFGGVNPEGFKNLLLSKMGIGDDVISAMKRGAFNEKTLSAAPVTSSGQIKALANIDAQWARITAKIEKLIDGLVVQFGPEIMKQIETFVEVGVDLVKAIAKLIITLKPAENIQKGIDALKNPEKIWKGIKQAGPEGTMRAFNRAIGIDEALDKIGGGITTLGKDIIKDASLMELKKAQGQYESKYGIGRKPKSEEGMIIEEQVNNNESNFYFDIKSVDPKETAREIKQVTSALNLIPTRPYGA
jgi:hypothetical protein